MVNINEFTQWPQSQCGQLSVVGSCCLQDGSEVGSQSLSKEPLNGQGGESGQEVDVNILGAWIAQPSVH